MEMNCCYEHYYGTICLSNLLQLSPCNDMFKVISNIMVRNDKYFIIKINFCNAFKIKCVLMFIMSNHYGRKYICILIQLEPCNDQFKFISGIMANWHELIKTFLFTINFRDAKKMNCALMFMNSNLHGT